MVLIWCFTRSAVIPIRLRKFRAHWGSSMYNIWLDFASDQTKLGLNPTPSHQIKSWSTASDYLHKPPGGLVTDTQTSFKLIAFLLHTASRALIIDCTCLTLNLSLWPRPWHCLTYNLRLARVKVVPHAQNQDPRSNWERRSRNLKMTDRQTNRRREAVKLPSFKVNNNFTYVTWCTGPHR